DRGAPQIGGRAVRNVSRRAERIVSRRDGENAAAGAAADQEPLRDAAGVEGARNAPSSAADGDAANDGPGAAPHPPDAGADGPGLREPSRAVMAVSSFPADALAFLRALKRNNRREWFKPRTARFDAVVRAPLDELIE